MLGVFIGCAMFPVAAVFNCSMAALGSITSCVNFRVTGLSSTYCICRTSPNGLRHHVGHQGVVTNLNLSVGLVERAWASGTRIMVLVRVLVAAVVFSEFGPPPTASSCGHWCTVGVLPGPTTMSAGEAEYYALVKAAAEGLVLAALGRDLEYEFSRRIWVDGSTAKATVTTLGLGKVRHMEVKFLWAQEALRRKLFEIRKVAGEENPAGVLTKANEHEGQLVDRDTANSW